MPAVDLSNFVTRAELAGQLAPLGEIRTMLRDDIGRLHRGQEQLSEQIAEMKAAITTRQDLANGRTAKNETAVTAAHEQIEAVAQQVRDVQADVTHIDTNGCDQKHRHVAILSALNSAGVVPDTGELLDAAEPTRWTRTQKAGALSAAGIGGLGLGALLPHVGPFLSWVATLLERGLKP